MGKTVKDFINNNELNIEQVINTYNNYIYTIIKNKISDSDTIEEILSDVFIILWKNQKKIDPNMEVKPYLIGITRNLIKKKYRDKVEYDDFEKVENVLGDNSIDAIFDSKEQVGIITSVLNESSEVESNIFIMFYYNGKKIKDISNALNISVSKVKIVLYRVRKRIKHRLMKEGYNHE